MSDIFKPLKSYSFEVHATELLGTDYVDVTVLSLLNYQTAARLGFDAAAMQAQVSPYLPDSVPKNYQNYTYLMLQTKGGETRFLAEEWIRSDTIQVRDMTTAIVTIGRVSPSDSTRIIAALNANNFNEVDVKFVN